MIAVTTSEAISALLGAVGVGVILGALIVFMGFLANR